MQNGCPKLMCRELASQRVVEQCVPVGELLGYARVSTFEQDAALQHDALSAAGCFRSWTDTASGALADRPELAAVMDVACHEHGTALSGFLPGSWDHLDCQSWDHPARLAGGSSDGSLTACVLFVEVEVIGRGIQGGRCG